MAQALNADRRQEVLDCATFAHIEFRFSKHVPYIVQVIDKTRPPLQGLQDAAKCDRVRVWIYRGER